MVWTSTAICGLYETLLSLFCNLDRVDGSSLKQRRLHRILHRRLKKALDDDIKAFMENQAELIEGLVRTHGVKLKKIKEMIGAESHYKKGRKVNFHKVLTHFKALEVNGGMFFKSQK
jgi:hypothetical protein